MFFWRIVHFNAFIWTSLVLCNSFENHWYDMQNVYKKVMNNLDNNQKIYENLVHPHWKKTRHTLVNTLLENPNKDIFNHKSIFENMLRKGKRIMQYFEITYLKHCLTARSRILIDKIKDTDFGGILLDISEFNCSANTLGQMYHLGRVLDTCIEKEIKVIVELGAGFGTLARITKQVLPNVTYIVIDLPEFLAVQYLYLKNTLNDISIIVHTSPNQPYSPGAIHLVPLHLLDDQITHVDVFISVFALSESPLLLQNKIIEKKFYNAQTLYIVGQINGWNENYEDSEHILKHVSSLFSEYYCQPYHLFDNAIWAYEAIVKQ